MRQTYQRRQPPSSGTLLSLYLHSRLNKRLISQASEEVKNVLFCNYVYVELCRSSSDIVSLNIKKVIVCFNFITAFRTDTIM